MVRARTVLPAAALLLIGSVGLISPSLRPTTASAATSIGFETPAVVDPIHTNGEPDIALDPSGRVFVSGPTGTGTQRSVWLGSVDNGHTYRIVTPCPLTPFPPPPGCPTPDAVMGTTAPPGGGDTDINFDRSGKQYFADLAALICLRTATTSDGGATVYQSEYPAGCHGVPGADRQWLAVFDPPKKPQSAYQGPFPLIYMEYNNLNTGAEWVKSNSALDPAPGGPGLNFFEATKGNTSVCPPALGFYAPFGADGYPQIDQVTGKVFQAAGLQNPDGTWKLALNIGTPDASGDLTFLDYPTAAKPCGDTSKLITIADSLPETPDTLFSVLSMDSARNLFVAWTVGGNGNATPPSDRQVFVSAASPVDAGGGWTAWSKRVQVSSGVATPSGTPGDAVNVFPWIKAGGPGRADAVWYGSDQSVDPSSHNNQFWNVFMNQVVFPTDAAGHVLVTSTPSATRQLVTPHPMHYDDVCLLGTNCITVQGNRNLADFFVVNIDRSGAAEIVYDDTSNGLVQGGACTVQVADHCGAGVITVARQSAGPGLNGANVSGPSNAPVAGISDPAGDALFPVINGNNVPGMDILSSRLHLSADGKTLNVITQVADLSHPAATQARIPGAASLQYITRWQLGNTIYYAGMEQNAPANAPTFYAGKAQTVDLCSVSACFPHVMLYPEPPFAPPAGQSGLPETGTVSCPGSPSAQNPCTLTISVNVGDVGTPTLSSLLESVGSYAFGASHPQNVTTNAQAEADNVPLEIDGACCYNFQASISNGGLPGCHEADGDGDVSDGRSGKAHVHFDEDACEDGAPEGVQESDAQTGDNFQSTNVSAMTFDDGLGNVTILGSGTHNGSPVTFSLVAVNGAAGVGACTLTLSDGYSVSGTLLDGSIQLQ